MVGSPVHGDSPKTFTSFQIPKTGPLEIVTNKSIRRIFTVENGAYKNDYVSLKLGVFSPKVPVAGTFLGKNGEAQKRPG